MFTSRNTNKTNKTMKPQIKRPISQNDIILGHLIKHGTITGLDSWRHYGVYRLSSVINRLRKIPNVVIITEMVEVDGVKFARYTLKL